MTKRKIFTSLCLYVTDPSTQRLYVRMCCRHVSSYKACSLLSASRAVVANNNPAPLTTMQRPPPHSHEPCPLFFRIQEIIWCCWKKVIRKKKKKKKNCKKKQTKEKSKLFVRHLHISSVSKKKYHRLTKSSQMPYSLVWFLNVFLMQHYISVVSEEWTTMHIYDPCASFFLSFFHRLEKYASETFYIYFRRTETFRQTFIFWIFFSVYLCRDHSMWQSLKVLAARHTSHSFKLTGLLLGGRYYCRWLEDVPLRSEKKRKGVG